MSTKNTLKIIFNIAGRISYVHRYLKLLENYRILIIKENLK